MTLQTSLSHTLIQLKFHKHGNYLVILLPSKALSTKGGHHPRVYCLSFPSAPFPTLLLFNEKQTGSSAEDLGTPNIKMEIVLLLPATVPIHICGQLIAQQSS